jgi:hypothetical protein
MINKKIFVVLLLSIVMVVLILDYACAQNRRITPIETNDKNDTTTDSTSVKKTVTYFEITKDNSFEIKDNLYIYSVDVKSIKTEERENYVKTSEYVSCLQTVLEFIEVKDESDDNVNKDPNAKVIKKHHYNIPKDPLHERHVYR